MAVRLVCIILVQSRRLREHRITTKQSVGYPNDVLKSLKIDQAKITGRNPSYIVRFRYCVSH